MVHEAPEGSIKNWGYLEKFFLTCFFEDDSKITMLTLLAMRQRKGEHLWRDFGIWLSVVLPV